MCEIDSFVISQQECHILPKSIKESILLFNQETFTEVWPLFTGWSLFREGFSTQVLL